LYAATAAHVRAKGFTVLVTNVFAGVAYLVYDALLYVRLREHRFDGFPEAF